MYHGENLTQTEIRVGGVALTEICFEQLDVPSEISTAHIVSSAILQ